MTVGSKLGSQLLRYISGGSTQLFREGGGGGEAAKQSSALSTAPH